jgi:hypothetical protein
MKPLLHALQYPRGALLGVLVLALVLRLVQLDSTSLYNDELSALTRTRPSAWSTLIDNGVRKDVHPALVQVFLWGWTRLAGQGEAVLRLPFVLISLVGLVLAYRCGQRWYGPGAGLFLAISLAALSLPLFLSRYARPYSPGLVFVLWAFDAQQRIAGQPWRWHRFLELLFALALALYTHYFAGLQAGLLGLWGVMQPARSLRRASWGAGAGALLLFGPHVPLTLHHMLSIGGLAWKGPPPLDFPLQFLWYATDHAGPVAAGGLLLLGYGLVRQRAPAHWARRLVLRRATLLALWLGPLVIGMAKSYWGAAVLHKLPAYFSFPFFLLWLGSFWPQARRASQGALLAWALLLCSSLLWGQQFYSQPRLPSVKGFVQTVKQHQTAAPGAVTTLLSMNNGAYFNYYASAVGAQAPEAFHLGHLGKLNRRLQTLQTERLVLGELQSPLTAMHYRLAQFYFPVQVRADSLWRGRVVSYRRSDCVRVVHHARQQFIGAQAVPATTAGASARLEMPPARTYSPYLFANEPLKLRAGDRLWCSLQVPPAYAGVQARLAIELVQQPPDGGAAQPLAKRIVPLQAYRNEAAGDSTGYEVLTGLQVPPNAPAERLQHRLYLVKRNDRRLAVDSLQLLQRRWPG